MCATLINMGHISWIDDEAKAKSTWAKVYVIAKEINYAQALDALASMAEQLGLDGGLDDWGRMA